MTGKKKATSRKGKTASEPTKLANAGIRIPMTGKSDESMTLPISALTSELEKQWSAIMSGIQASLLPINLSLDAVCKNVKNLEAYEPRIPNMEVCLSDRAGTLRKAGE